MDYLQRLIQRSSSKTPRNTLMPNSNNWAGVIDPFENSLFMPPVFPDVPKQHNAETQRSDTGMLLTSPASKQPAMLNDRALGDPPALSDPLIQATAAPVHESVRSNVWQKVSPKISTPNPARKEPAPARNNVSKVETTTAPPDRRQEDQNGMGFAHRPIIPQPENPWIRRYRAVMNPSCNQSAHSKEKRGKTLESAYGAPPGSAPPLLNNRPGLPFAKTSSAATRRRVAKKEPSESPRLVIGRLNVDVVPVTKRRPAYRRTVPLKRGIHSSIGKLTQAEAARIGFGIGQM